MYIIPKNLKDNWDCYLLANAERDSSGGKKDENKTSS